MFVIRKKYEHTEGYDFTVEVFFYDLRQYCRRVVEEVSQRSIIVIFRSVCNAVGYEACADDDGQGDLLQFKRNIVILEISQCFSPYVRSGFVQIVAMARPNSMVWNLSAVRLATKHSASLLIASPMPAQKRVNGESATISILINVWTGADRDSSSQQRTCLPYT